MNTRSLFAIFLSLLLAVGVYAQRPPQPGGFPGGPGGPGGPGFPGGPGRGPRGPEGPGGQGQRDPGPRNEWNKAVDTNKDGNVDASELQAAIDRTFTSLDRNGNGVIDTDEGRTAPRPPAAGQGQHIDKITEGMDLLPPFFFDRALRNDATLTREQFAAAVRGVFNEMDKNHDGVLSKDEARPPRRNEGDRRVGGEPGAPPAPPNAQFIAAELRFGDKMIDGHPFSADTVLEDTRRLYDGSTVTRSMKGAFYRDGAGRTRREQPLEMIGGVQVSGTNGQPQMMVFINDFGSKTQTFLDVNNKVARTHPIGNIAPPADGRGEPQDAKVESLGTKTIEGIKAEGTRTSFQIPAGQLGDKPMEVVTETWFSPELQVMVMSRHVDPIAGEHIFRLTNIKLGEPSADLFTVPQGYRVESGGDRHRQE